MNQIIMILPFIFLTACKTETLQSVLDQTLNQGGKPTQKEVSMGLKEALSVSIERGAKALASQDGYLKNELVKIFLPQEVQSVKNTLNKIGLSALTNELEVKLNRAAEDAAIKAVPIFKEAILKMSFNDAMNVLLGPKDAATSYLKSKTSDQILQEFKPVIANSLNKVGAAEIWSQIFTRYNAVPFVKKVDTDLISYTSNSALKGMFLTVSQKEEGIRENMAMRTSPLLRKVFNWADSASK